MPQPPFLQPIIHCAVWVWVIFLEHLSDHSLPCWDPSVDGSLANAGIKFQKAHHDLARDYLFSLTGHHCIPTVVPQPPPACGIISSSKVSALPPWYFAPLAEMSLSYPFTWLNSPPPLRRKLDITSFKSLPWFCPKGEPGVPCRFSHGSCAYPHHGLSPAWCTLGPLRT